MDVFIVVVLDSSVARGLIKKLITLLKTKAKMNLKTLGMGEEEIVMDLMVIIVCNILVMDKPDEMAIELVINPMIT